MASQARAFLVTVMALALRWALHQPDQNTCFAHLLLWPDPLTSFLTYRQGAWGGRWLQRNLCLRPAVH